MPAIKGDYVAALALSEAGAGSDLASISTTAQHNGDDYIINGQKMWITNATHADFFCTLVNTSDDEPHKNKSLVVIPSKIPGVTVGQKIDKIGQLTSDTAPVYFENVRIPKRYCIGEEGEGFVMQMKHFTTRKIVSCGKHDKVLEKCIVKTMDYCRERQTFGASVLDNQSIQFKLAELQTEVEALRSLVYRACEEEVSGKDMTYLASMAKLAADWQDKYLIYVYNTGVVWVLPLKTQLQNCIEMVELLLF